MKAHFETNAVRVQTERTQYREHSSPLFLTSSFVFDSQEQARDLFEETVDGNIYSRFSNPSVTELTEKLCLLENTEDGMVTATGMAAVYVSLAAFLKTGDHLIASRALFGSSYQIITTLLPKWGIDYTFVDLSDSSGWASAVKKNTKMFFFETPSNPGLQIGNIRVAAALCKNNHILLNVDNCFATPYLQSPVEMGADIVTHSATKFIDGQGRVLGGAILGTKDIIKTVRFFCRHTGPSISPFNAWILSKSLETLAVRMDRHCDNALNLAKQLERHPRVKTVAYPFLPSHPDFDTAKKQMKKGGPLFTIDLPGGIEPAMKFCNALQMISRSSNLGDTRTIATHPTTTTHSKLPVEERKRIGITDGLIRFSVGLEHPDDILADIMQALDKSV